MVDKKECKLCDTVTAVFGLLLGTIILFISIDLISGGKLSGLISGNGEAEMEETTDD